MPDPARDALTAFDLETLRRYPTNDFSGWNAERIGSAAILLDAGLLADEGWPHQFVVTPAGRVALALAERAERAEAELAAVTTEKNQFLRQVRRIVSGDLKDWTEEVKALEPGKTAIAATLIDLANLRLARDGFSRKCKALRAERDRLREAALDTYQQLVLIATHKGVAEHNADILLDQLNSLEAALDGTPGDGEGECRS